MVYAPKIVVVNQLLHVVMQIILLLREISLRYVIREIWFCHLVHSAHTLVETALRVSAVHNLLTVLNMLESIAHVLIPVYILISMHHLEILLMLRHAVAHLSHVMRLKWSLPICVAALA